MPAPMYIPMPARQHSPPVTPTSTQPADTLDSATLQAVAQYKAALAQRYRKQIQGIRDTEFANFITADDLNDDAYHLDVKSPSHISRADEPPPPYLEDDDNADCTVTVVELNEPETPLEASESMVSFMDLDSSDDEDEMPETPMRMMKRMSISSISSKSGSPRKQSNQAARPNLMRRFTLQFKGPQDFEASRT